MGEVGGGRENTASGAEGGRGEGEGDGMDRGKRVGGEDSLIFLVASKTNRKIYVIENIYVCRKETSQGNSRGNATQFHYRVYEVGGVGVGRWREWKWELVDILTAYQIMNLISTFFFNCASIFLLLFHSMNVIAFKLSQFLNITEILFYFAPFVLIMTYVFILSFHLIFFLTFRSYFRGVFMSPNAQQM